MKSIFITGAASGIGKACALLFAQRSWFVGLFDLNAQALEEVQAQIDPEKSCSQVLDVRNETQVKSALDLFAHHTGGEMHLLFNNAGILHMGAFERMPLSQQKDILDVNIYGILNCTHQALPLLKNTPNAHIVNMSSASALYGIPEFAVYSASKHAVRALTEALSLELEHYTIRVSDLMPSFVSTPMVHTEAYRAGSLKKAQNLISPEAIAEQVWKAYGQPRVHWKMPKYLAFADYILGLIPGARRRFIKKSTLGD